MLHCEDRILHSLAQHYHCINIVIVIVIGRMGHHRVIDSTFLSQDTNTPLPLCSNGGTSILSGE